MSIIDSCERNPGRDGEWSVYTIAGLYKPKYTRTFQVITDDPTTEQAEILDYFTTNEVALLDEYPYAMGSPGITAVASAIKVRVTDDNPLHWIVTVDYTDSNALLNTDIELDIGVHRYQTPFVKAYDTSGSGGVLNVPVVNSAGDPFDPPPTRDKAMSVLNFTKYAPYTSVEDMLDHVALFNDSLNEDEFHGQPPGNCKMTVKGRRVRDIDHYVSMFTYEIEMNEEGWIASICNRGFYYLTNPSVASSKVKFQEGIGKHPTTAQPLTANGGKLAAGNPLTYSDFNKYRSVGWAVLGLE